MEKKRDEILESAESAATASTAEPSVSELLKRRIHMDTDGSRELAAAIVKSACVDYEKVLRALLRGPTGKQKEKLLMQKAENERFFQSQWCDVLLESASGESFIRQIQTNAVRKERERAEARLKKAKDKIAKAMVSES